MPSSDKVLRRNILSLWGQAGVNDEELKELDRYVIALYRLQRDGRVDYRQLVGVHEGGWGSKDAVVNQTMYQKALLDAQQAYTILKPNDDSKFPHDDQDVGSGTVPPQPDKTVLWPDPQPNVTPEAVIGLTSAQNPDQETWHLAHQFCWHAQSPFFVWHRPYVLMFEWLLQDHDPVSPGLHRGRRALGAHYFKWDDWDGVSLHPLLGSPTYTIRTRAFESLGFSQGTQIDNPLYRWFAPATVADQKAQYFPATLNRNNSTTRSAAFEDASKFFTFPWPLTGDPVATPPSYSLQHIVQRAMNNPNWLDVSTVYWGSTNSMENPHNKFHNRVGGGVYFNPAAATSNTPGIAGTMTTNQSPFDPIFWVHHSNVERQLLSWQRIWNDSPNPESKPPEALNKFVLYPWTKPSLFYNVPKPGEKPAWGLATSPAPGNDGTFADWFDPTQLPYEYDEYITPAPADPTTTIRGVTLGVPRSVRLEASIDPSSAVLGGAEYELLLDNRTICSVAMISGMGGACARCRIKTSFLLTFVVAGVPEFEAAAAQGSVPETLAKRLVVRLYGINHSNRKVLGFIATFAKTMRGTAALATVAPPLGCLGKGHKPASLEKTRQLVVAVVAGEGAHQNARDILKLPVVQEAVAGIAAKEHCQVVALGDPPQRANVVLFLGMDIDGPTQRALAFTSHLKPNSSYGSFDLVQKMLRGVPHEEDCVCLYVSKSVPEGELGSTVAHLLGHAVGRNHGQ